MAQDRFLSVLHCRIFLLDVDFLLQIFSTLISLLCFCLLPLPRKESSKMSTSQHYSSRKREKKQQAQSSKRLFFTSPSPLWSPLAATAFVDVQGSSRLTHSTGRSKGHFHSFTRKKFQWLLKPRNPDMINVYRRQIWFRWRSWVGSNLNWWGRKKLESRRRKNTAHIQSAPVAGTLTNDSIILHKDKLLWEARKQRWAGFLRNCTFVFPSHPQHLSLNLSQEFL